MRKQDKIAKQKEQEALRVARLDPEYRLRELRLALKALGNLSKSAPREGVSI